MSFNPTLDAVPDVSLPLRAHRLSGARGGWGWGFLPSFAAALIGTMLSIAAALVVSRWEDRNAERTFDVIAENHSMALQHGLDEYLTKLMALRALFNSEDTVGRGEFEAFAQALLRYNSDAQNSLVAAAGPARRARRVRADRCARGTRRLRHPEPCGRRQPLPIAAA